MKKVALIFLGIVVLSLVLSTFFFSSGDRVGSSYKIVARDVNERVVYIRDHESLIGSYVSGNTYYYHTDMVKTVRMVSDSIGNFEVFRYSPFGKSNIQGPSFTGKQRTEFGSIALGARDYYVNERRFGLPDPLHSDAASPYSYAGNNPLKYSDPSGLFSVKHIGGDAVSAEDKAETMKKVKQAENEILKRLGSGKLKAAIEERLLQIQIIHHDREMPEDYVLPADPAHPEDQGSFVLTKPGMNVGIVQSEKEPGKFIILVRPGVDSKVIEGAMRTVLLEPISGEFGGTPDLENVQLFNKLMLERSQHDPPEIKSFLGIRYIAFNDPWQRVEYWQNILDNGPPPGGIINVYRMRGSAAELDAANAAADSLALEYISKK